MRREVIDLFEEIVRIVKEIRAKGLPETAAAWHNNVCGINSGAISTSVVWMPGSFANSLKGAALRVNDWNGPMRLPSPENLRAYGREHIGATHYAPKVSEENEWAWRWTQEFDESPIFFVPGADELYRSAELAERIVRRHIDRLYGGG